MLDPSLYSGVYSKIVYIVSISWEIPLPLRSGPDVMKNE